MEFIGSCLWERARLLRLETEKRKAAREGVPGHDKAGREVEPFETLPHAEVMEGRGRRRATKDRDESWFPVA